MKLQMIIESMVIYIVSMIQPNDFLIELQEQFQIDCNNCAYMFSNGQN